MSVVKCVVFVVGLLAIVGVTQVGAQSNPELIAADEPAAAGLARDLVGEPEGERLTGVTLELVTEEVASLLRCPVCQGLSVADSPTTSALAMRAETRDLLASGYTEEQVLAYFERSYGEFIRLWPKPEGFNLVVWLLPTIGLLAGALVIGGRMRRRARLAAGSAQPSEAEIESGSEKPAVGAPPSSEIPEELAAYIERVRREVNE